MRVRIVAAVFAAALVAACATSATNTLPQTKRDALRIDDIALSFAPDAAIVWSDGMNDYKTSGIPDSPDTRRAFLAQKAAPHIQHALDEEIRPHFRGTDPARLMITVRQLQVPSGAMRVLFASSYGLRAQIRLVDIRTGQTLLEAPEFNGVVTTQGGLIAYAIEQAFPNPIDRVSRAFSSALMSWLQTGQAFASGTPGATLRR